MVHSKPPLHLKNTHPTPNTHQDLLGLDQQGDGTSSKGSGDTPADADEPPPSSHQGPLTSGAPSTHGPSTSGGDPPPSPLTAKSQGGDASAKSLRCFGRPQVADDDDAVSQDADTGVVDNAAPHGGVVGLYNLGMVVGWWVCV